MTGTHVGRPSLGLHHGSMHVRRKEELLLVRMRPTAVIAGCPKCTARLTVRRGAGPEEAGGRSPSEPGGRGARRRADRTCPRHDMTAWAPELLSDPGPGAPDPSSLCLPHAAQWFVSGKPPLGRRPVAEMTPQRPRWSGVTCGGSVPPSRRVCPAMPIPSARGQGDTPRGQRLSTEGRGASSATGIPCPLLGQ